MEIIAIRRSSFTPRLGLFASREIPPNEELTFSYGNPPRLDTISQEDRGKLIACRCGAFDCGGFIPFDAEM